MYYRNKIICVYIHFPMFYEKKGIYENFTAYFLEYMSLKFKCQQLEKVSEQC